MQKISKNFNILKVFREKYGNHWYMIERYLSLGYTPDLYIETMQIDYVYDIFRELHPLAPLSWRNYHEKSIF